jgi:predicted DCC family thiol-disulfide oxidoreductase YuxK
MTTEAADRERTVGRVFFDGDCAICTHAVRRFEGVFARRGFALEPLQAPGACDTLGISEAERLSEMRLRLQDGTVFGGAAAVVEIARRIWWAWPLWAISRLPGAMLFLHAGYRWLARHRRCANGACRITRPVSRTVASMVPLIVLPAGAVLSRSWLPPWMFMWALAAAIYAGFKWLTYCRVRESGVAIDPLRTIAYLFAWPGMDAAAFLSQAERQRRPARSEWMVAALKTAFGAALLLYAAPAALPGHPMLAGWLAMAGLVFVLHFGTFHLLSLGWRTVGVNAVPLMCNPLRSASLADFWGRRWNTAFHELATRFSFRPLRVRVGPAVATFLVFLLSGAIHELVISLPARGGYGLPTGYFVVQGLGLLSERSTYGRRIGLGRGWRGWLFTMVVTAGPAYWLFPPPFVYRVVLPMLAPLAHAEGSI